MQFFLMLLGALVCAAKDSGTRQQALDAKQQNALRSKHIVQHEQAIDLNVRHQQIQSVDLKEHHSDKAGQGRSGEKRCGRNRVVAGVLAILLPFVGAHRWYVLFYTFVRPIHKIDNLESFIFSFSRMEIFNTRYCNAGYSIQCACLQ